MEKAGILRDAVDHQKPQKEGLAEEADEKTPETAGQQELLGGAFKGPSPLNRGLPRASFYYLKTKQRGISWRMLFPHGIRWGFRLSPKNRLVRPFKRKNAMNRKWNFNAGPSTLPLEVLEELRDTMVDFHGMGLSLIEASHRNKEYDAVHNQAIDLVRELLGLPRNYKVLFLGGGATLQFSMVPMNLLLGERRCDFVLSGAWAQKAYADAVKIGGVNVLFDGNEGKYTSLPKTVTPSEGASYLHITSNETIGGVQWGNWPETGQIPLVADMSSDIMSRPLPVEKFGLIYAGAQKNLGPSGVSLVIIREDLLERSRDDLTAYLSYQVHAKGNSLYNTPPVFPIYAMKLVLEWLKKRGGLEVMQKENEEKAALVYETINNSGGFYNCPVVSPYRSRMNIVFTLPREELFVAFLKEAEEQGFVGLKGHRSMGGCRASVYNAMPREGVAGLASFMANFAKKNG